MKLKYITIDVRAVTDEFIAKLLYGYEVEPEDCTLVYKLSNGDYFISTYTTEQWEHLTCKTQEQFIETIEQHKLMRML